MAGAPSRSAVVGPATPSSSAAALALGLYLTLTAELVALAGIGVVDARRSTSVLYLHLLEVEREGAIEHQRRHVLDVEERVVRAFQVELRRSPASSRPRGPLP